jgi:23S rRNA (uracil1939-C5)-methyltransferase
MVYGGLALARTDKGVVFIDGALPGETVDACMDESKKGGVPGATCVKVITPSPMRRKPSCPLFGECGGCNWLHINHDSQLSIKEGVFAETLKRTGKITDIPKPVVFASLEFGYRRRIQIKIDGQNHSAGFFKKKSHTIVSVPHCPLLCDSLNKLLKNIPSAIQNLPPRTEQIKVIASGSEDTSEIASFPVIDNCTTAYTKIQCGAFTFTVSGSSFFQSNIFCAENLGACVSSWLRGETFLDLYGGSGFLSAFASNKFTNGFLVDNEVAHCEMAQKTFVENGINNVQAIHDSAWAFCTKAISRNLKVDSCIVDPPRTGLDTATLQSLLTLAPATIMYVSCDPATLARDAGILIKKGGYVCEKTAIFDFYPQTHHIESAVLLTKK